MRYTAMPTVHAIEHVRRMRGGAQSQLIRCSDGCYYVVKFQNNPQHARVLVNEMLGTRLAWRLGLPTTPVAVVQVSEELIRLTPDLCIEMPRQRIPCKPGPQFGSRFPGDPRRLALYDFLPDTLLNSVANLASFAGMLVFDKWTCNTNGRQTLFLREAREDGAATENLYTTLMIDQGFCFNSGEWNFPDGPLRGLYARNQVYQGVTGHDSFEPWIERVRKFSDRSIEDLVHEVPSEWYEDDLDALLSLAERLHRRRNQVADLIWAAKNTTRHPFPNWV